MAEPLAPSAARRRACRETAWGAAFADLRGRSAFARWLANELRRDSLRLPIARFRKGKACLTGASRMRVTSR